MAATALLTACDSTSPLRYPATVPASPSSPFSTRSSRLKVGESWVAPGAVQQALLYVSDEGTNQVYIYSWPAAKLVGRLTGITYPQGECVDEAGDVFVTSIGTKGRSHIYEYPHGSTKPIAKLDDVDFPHGCAVDPTTGNLAVTNLQSNLGSGTGNVEIYNQAHQFLGYYYAPEKYYYFFCGYDEAGNLFVDAGGNINNDYGLAELPAGGTTMNDVSLNQTISYPGAVQWHGQYVAVGDTAADVIYQFSISGSTGTLAGTTRLGGASDILQFWIKRGTVVAANAGSATVKYWNYPAGGRAIKAITGLTDPVGAVVSLRR